MPEGSYLVVMLFELSTTSQGQLLAVYLHRLPFTRQMSLGVTELPKVAVQKSAYYIEPLVPPKVNGISLRPPKASCLA